MKASLAKSVQKSKQNMGVSKSSSKDSGKEKPRVVQRDSGKEKPRVVQRKYIVIGFRPIPVNIASMYFVLI